MAVSTRVCSVLFADISGSTRLYEQLGDAEALNVIGRCLNRVDRAIVACGGVVVKTIGDELMATFDTAEMACHAAGVMQARIDGLPAIAGEKMSIRVGFHHGSVLVDGADVYGNTVNIAARIAEVSQAKQVITSAETAQMLPAAVRKQIKTLEPIMVKGLRTPLDIVELAWRNDAGARLAQTNAPTPPVAPAAKKEEDSPVRVILRYGKQEVLLRGNAALVTLGRDQANDIVIHDPRASRQHASIELRNGSCILVDKSSNGTFVSSDKQNNLALHNEEAVLQGVGRICFGHICAPDSQGSLGFEVQMVKQA